MIGGISVRAKFDGMTHFLKPTLDEIADLGLILCYQDSHVGRFMPESGVQFTPKALNEKLLI